MQSKRYKIMAIKLIFTIQNEVFMIFIKGKEVYYNDPIQKLQMLFPNPSEISLKINGPPTEKEMAEYNVCKTEDELAAFCIRDVRLKGGRLIKKEKINET